MTSRSSSGIPNTFSRRNGVFPLPSFDPRIDAFNNIDDPGNMKEESAARALEPHPILFGHGQVLTGRTGDDEIDGAELARNLFDKVVHGAFKNGFRSGLS